MGVSKKEIFSSQQNKMAELAKSLAHPARIAILDYLLRTNACVCGDLVGEIGLAQATVSQHLKELKKAGLIQGTIEGTSTCYCINHQRWEEISDLFSAFFSQKNACGTGSC